MNLDSGKKEDDVTTVASVSRRGLGSLTLSLVAGIVIAGLSGCSALEYEPSATEAAVISALADEEGAATVDFDEIILGEWSRMVIVCNGANAADLSTALGFTWADAPDLADANFGSMALFATARSVEQTLGPRRDESGDTPYFTPCTPPSLGGSESPKVIAVDRADALMDVEFDEKRFGRPVWYPTAAEFSRLASSSSCDEAFDALPPADEVDGLFILVSSELAQTLDSCSTYSEWMLALQRAPSAVGAEEISDELAMEYLASACTLRRTVLGEAGPQCEAAAADGVIA